jgi:nucleotide-binding universal stress UspA family protein
MQVILVPIDFSPQSRNAAAHAAMLAKSFHGKLLLFHAYMLPTPVSEVPYVMVTVDDLQKDNEQLIKKEAEYLNNQFGVEVEWLVRIGIPSDEIKALTEERRIDLVVMGMKGVGGLDKLIGSTTTNCLRKLKTPVLIIPQDANFAEYKHITYATDFHNELLTRSFDPLVKIARQFSSNISIVYIHRDSDRSDVNETDWRKNMTNIFPDINYSFVKIEDDSVKHGLTEFIESSGTDLLVMLTHRHNFFERLFNRSQTTTMAYETRVPLLVLHDIAG